MQAHQHPRPAARATQSTTTPTTNPGNHQASAPAAPSSSSSAAAAAAAPSPPPPPPPPQPNKRPRQPHPVALANAAAANTGAAPPSPARRVRARLEEGPVSLTATTRADHHPVTHAKAASTSAARWRGAEHFMADLDAPYFAHSDFLHVLRTDMLPLLAADPTLGGPPPPLLRAAAAAAVDQSQRRQHPHSNVDDKSPHAPSAHMRARRQWARIRSRMCTVFPAGCARPRRLSSAFLASERRELETYRTDARAVLRGHPLPPAVDGRSGTTLRPEWSQRYPFDLPPPPPRGADVIVRRVVPEQNKPMVANPTCSKHQPRKRKGFQIVHSTDKVQYLNAKFLSLAPNGKITIHFSGKDVSTVPDLNIMSPVPRIPAADTPQPTASPATPHPSPFSTGAWNSTFTPTGTTRYLNLETDARPLAASATHLSPSPRKAISFKARSATNVEFEVHVRALAESVRLLDRKDNLLSQLAQLNDAAERQLEAFSPADRLSSIRKISDDVRRRHAVVLETLAHINARLDTVLPGLSSSVPGRAEPLASQKGLQEQEALGELHGDARGTHAAAALAFLAASHSGYKSHPHYDLASTSSPGTETFGDNFAWRDDSSTIPISTGSDTIFRRPSTVRGDHTATEFACRSRLGKAASSVPAGVQNILARCSPADLNAYPVFDPHSEKHEDSIDQSRQRDDGAVSHVPFPVTDPKQAWPRREALAAGPRAEDLAKNVDFRTAQGAALLGKALTRQALARLPNANKLKLAPAAVRADVVECVSTCVAILTRARTTRSSHAIEELVDALRVKSPRNLSALAAIQNAVKEFDSTSSDSE